MDLKTRRTIEHEIEERERNIRQLEEEKRNTYLKVKDFGTADAIAVDVAIEKIKKIDQAVKAHRKEIALRQNKLKLADRIKL